MAWAGGGIATGLGCGDRKRSAKRSCALRTVRQSPRVKTIERPTVVRHAKAAKTSVVAVLETTSEVPARKVSDTSTHAAAEMSATDTRTDMRSAQAAAEVGPTNAAAQVRTPDASSKVSSAKVTSPNTAAATACKGVGCQCGASQRHGED